MIAAILSPPESHEATDPMSIPVLISRRHPSLLVQLLVACIAALGLTALILVVEPPARIGLTVLAALALVGVAVWSGGRPQPAARELDRLVAMSGDLSRAVDAEAAGDLMARHLALAAGVDQSGVCYWDSVTGEVLTLGYYPPERRSPVGMTYRLADYPECQRALDEQVAVVLDAADPRLPTNERDYLASIGGSVLAVIPLVANGRSIGLVELTSERPTTLDTDRLRVARSMAHMAAMLLENARLSTSCASRHSTTRSRDWRTGRCSGTGSPTRSSAALATRAPVVRSCSSTSMTSST